MTGFVIRRMKRRDIPQVLRIIAAHAYDDSDAAGRYFGERSASKELWRNPDERHYVAQLGGDIVALSGVRLDTEGGDQVWWLSWFFVQLGLRRSGIGTAMFARALEHARAQGGRKIFVDTSSLPGFAPARGFLQARGCVEEGRLIDFYADGDHMVLYGLNL